MKRIKLLPSILMLVLCVGILAIGVYAASPITGTINGTINITAAQGVKIAVYRGTSATAENLIDSAFGSSQVELAAGGATLDASSAASPEQVTAQVYTVVLSTNQATNYVVDTETIQVVDGFGATSGEKVSGAAVITKLHKPTAGAVDANGNACFTKDKPYTIQVSIKCGKLSTEAINVSYDIDMKIYTEAEYTGTGVNGVDYLYFGQYPQSKVQVFESPEAITGYTETAEIFNIASGAKNVYVKDGEVNGSKYIWAYGRESDIAGTPDSTYMYKIEPIKWRILSSDLSTGKMKVMSEKIIDRTPFQLYDGNYTYLNNYNESILRDFFVDKFYNNAFDKSEQTIILAETVDNATENQYDCGNTTDKVFALSLFEVKNTSYGFENTKDDSTTRCLTDTSFSYDIVYYTRDSGYGNWWLRTVHGPAGDYYGEFVNSSGNLNGDGISNDVSTYNGCVPAMVIGI